MDSSDPGYKGYKEYTPRFLRMYDWWVVGVVAPRIWKMGAGPGIDLYKRHMGQRHLDVGPGTGFFIAEAEPPTDTELTLVDANPNVLNHCAETLAAWEPLTIEANVLRPLPIDGPFDSAALMHVIHCLPAPMAAKSESIKHIAATLTDDGVLFGGTLLGLTADHTRPARTFVRIANALGGFDNLSDNVDSLERILEQSFVDVEIEIPTGSVAYFVASRPRKAHAIGAP